MSDLISEPVPPPDSAYSGDMQMEQLRVPPHSLQAEQAVLGGLMLDNGAWDKIADPVSDRTSVG